MTSSKRQIDIISITSNLTDTLSIIIIIIITLLLSLVGNINGLINLIKWIYLNAILELSFAIQFTRN